MIVLDSRCLNGTEVNGACLCRQGYIGTHCTPLLTNILPFITYTFRLSGERSMNCRSFERSKNGSCVDGCVFRPNSITLSQRMC